MSTTTADLVDKYVRVDGYKGIAWWVKRLETESRLIEPDWDELPEGVDADTWWPDEDDFEEVETGRLVCVMVGDDREWFFDADDVHIIDDDDFCHSCGQIGCAW